MSLFFSFNEHYGDNRQQYHYPKEVNRILAPVFNQSDKSGRLIYELLDMKDPKEYLLLLLLLADAETPDRIHELEKLDYNTLRDKILSWNNWHKQTIVNIQEYLWYRYIQLERLMHKIHL